MTRTPTLALRASVACIAALALVACTPAAPAETEAPATPSSPPAPSTTAPTAQPTPSETGADAQAFESQDGAVRFTLPEGWSVDDRSAMGPVSEMYDRGPGWLNDLVLLDETGAQMLWYREHYGNDFIDCYPSAADIAIPATPRTSGGDAFEFQIRSGLQPLTEWDGEQDVPTGEWVVSLDLMVRQPPIDGDDCGWADELPAATRMVMMGAVGDQPGEQGEPSQIVFDSEQGARDWLEGAEAATLIEVLSSVELTDAPMLDEAP